MAAGIVSAATLIVLMAGCDARRRDDIAAWLELGDGGPPPAVRVTDRQSSSPPSRSPAPAPAPSTGSIVAPRDAFRLSLRNVQVCPARSSRSEDLAHEIWGVEVEIVARSADDVPVNRYYARLVDSQGSAYTAVTEGCGPQLAAAPLHAGQSARGWLDFRVPRARAGFTLVYAPRIGASAKASKVKLPLGR